jgi:DNA-binding NarL/FixJ family response regulator
MNKKINIVIADDHSLIVDGLKTLLKRYHRIGKIDAVYNGKELLHYLKNSRPDVILLDMKMPEMDGIEACDKISRKYPEIKILVLTQYSDNMAVKHMISAGANGYLLKDSNSDELFKAIDHVVDHDFYKNDISYKAMVLDSRRQYQKDHFLPETELTKQEKELLKYICHEKTCEQIGEIMCISKRTVEAHRGKLMRKIGVKSVVGLVKFAIEKGYHM